MWLSWYFKSLAKKGRPTRNMRPLREADTQSGGTQRVVLKLSTKQEARNSAMP